MQKKDAPKRKNRPPQAKPQKGMEEKDSPTQAFEEGEPRLTGRRRAGGEDLERRPGQK